MSSRPLQVLCCSITCACANVPAPSTFEGRFGGNRACLALEPSGRFQLELASEDPDQWIVASGSSERSAAQLRLYIDRVSSSDVRGGMLLHRQQIEATVVGDTMTFEVMWPAHETPVADNVVEVALPIHTVTLSSVAHRSSWRPATPSALEIAK